MGLFHSHSEDFFSLDLLSVFESMPKLFSINTKKEKGLSDICDNIHDDICSWGGGRYDKITYSSSKVIPFDDLCLYLT